MTIQIHKDSSGHNSMKRIGAIIGFFMISFAFGLMAWKGKITDRMFIAYPVGCFAFYAPQLFITIAKIWTRQCTPPASQALPSGERTEVTGKIAKDDI